MFLFLEVARSSSGGENLGEVTGAHSHQLKFRISSFSVAAYNVLADTSFSTEKLLWLL